MRATRAGLGLTIGAVACIATGRVLGLPELFVLAAISITCLVFALLHTITIRLDLQISRTATPERLRVGAPARIDLKIVNSSRYRTPILQATDSIDGRQGAAIMLAPIHSGQQSQIAYRLPTERRGVIPVGPLTLTMGDPLGLARSEVTATGVTNLVVHPTLIPLEPITSFSGRDSSADRRQIRSLSISGEEFFALRPYQPGDELKRVHWRATARLGELVVRQAEHPKTGRITVLLDQHKAAYDQQGFERAVSAALSVLHSAYRGGDSLRFVTSANSHGTEIRSRQELDAVDEQLATIGQTQSASILRSLERLGRSSDGGTLVLITGSISQQLEVSIARAKRSFGHTIVIACQTPEIDLPSPSIIHDGRPGLAQTWAEINNSARPETGRKVLKQ